MGANPYPSSYYFASAIGLIQRPEPRGNLRCDVCVVGAGYTGLNAAIELAERGYRVVVLEANRVGWGASGRNGGQLCTGFSRGQESVVHNIGKEDAQRLFDMTEEAKRIVAGRIEAGAIPCDLKWGYLYAAPKERHLPDLRAEIDHMARDYGYEKLSYVPESELGDYVGTNLYKGGLFDAGGGHLHPLNYALGLARMAEDAGAVIYEGARVLSIEEGEPLRLKTEHATITAGFAVLGANAYIDDLVPALRAKIMPVETYVLATEPMGENRAKRALPRDIAVADTNFILNYFRLSADKRMLFGGRASYTRFAPPNLAAAMRRSMLEVFPDLSDLEIQHVWGGYVGITMDRTPHLGRIGRNVYFAQGYSGQGVGITAIAARVMAEAIAGQAERFDVFARLKHHDFPGGRLLRTPTLALAMAWFKLRDLVP